MSRGLGKVQQAILARLADCDGWESINSIANMVYHPERYHYQGVYYFSDGDADSYDCTKSETSSIHRSIQKLERSGLVETETQTGDFRAGFERGGVTKYKRVRLCVDTKGQTALVSTHSN